MLTGEFRQLDADEERDLALLRPRVPGCRGFLAAFEASPPWREWLASDARRRLIESCVPWAWRVAAGAGCPALGDDRFGVAMLALCRAVDRFEPAKGRLTTYVDRTVVNEVRRAAAAERTLVRVPEFVQRRVRELDGGVPGPPRSPSIDGLVPLARVALAPARRDLGDDEAGRASPWDRVPDPRAGPDDDPPDAVARLRAAIGRLAPEQAAVVRLYHFGDAPDPPPQRRVAEALGVSRQAVQQRLDAAYCRLRRELARPAP